MNKKMLQSVTQTFWKCIHKTDWKDLTQGQYYTGWINEKNQLQVIDNVGDIFECDKDSPNRGALFANDDGVMFGDMSLI